MGGLLGGFRRYFKLVEANFLWFLRLQSGKMASFPTAERRVWTTRQLLSWTTTYFTDKGVDSPRLSAEMLLAYVLEVPRLNLYMDPDRPASDLERAAYRGLVERAACQEPVDYLVGQAPFFSLVFKV
jgi:release factor glutamine methyltransferase